MSSGAPEPRAALARLRIAAGLSQAQLASVLGVSSSRVVRGWESGRFAPRVDQLPRLARAFGVPVDVIVDAIVGPAANGLASARPPIAPSRDALDEIRRHLRDIERLVESLRDAGDQPSSPRPPGGSGDRVEDADSRMAEGPTTG